MVTDRCNIFDNRGRIDELARCFLSEGKNVGLAWPIGWDMFFDLVCCFDFIKFCNEIGMNVIVGRKSLIEI